MTVIDSVALNRPTVFEKPVNDVDLLAVIAIDLAAYVEKRDRKESGFKAAYEAEVVLIEKELN